MVVHRARRSQGKGDGPESPPRADLADVDGPESQLEGRRPGLEREVAVCRIGKQGIGDEPNVYRKARSLHDWVWDNVAYNGIWAWRESLFSPYGCASEDVRKRRVGDCPTQSGFYAALCRSVGVPARVSGGRIYQPGIRNGHFWAEVYFPAYGWMPVDVTFAEGTSVLYQRGKLYHQYRIGEPVQFPVIERCIELGVPERSQEAPLQRGWRDSGRPMSM